jgi:hypothetical protein
MSAPYSALTCMAPSVPGRRGSWGREPASVSKTSRDRRCLVVLRRSPSLLLLRSYSGSLHSGVRIYHTMAATSWIYSSCQKAGRQQSISIVQFSKKKTICKGRDQANPICKLWPRQTRITFVMVANCSYAKGLWGKVEAWSREQGLVISRRNIRDWWAQLIKRQDQSNGKERAMLITYTVWNLWKERCRRVIRHAHDKSFRRQSRTTFSRYKLAQEEL